MCYVDLTTYSGNQVISYSIGAISSGDNDIRNCVAKVNSTEGLTINGNVEDYDNNLNITQEKDSWCNLDYDNIGGQSSNYWYYGVGCLILVGCILDILLNGIH